MAAGVRWLRHLHQVAQESGGGQVQQEQDEAREAPQAQQQPAGGQVAQHCQPAEQQQQAGLQGWAAEARQHASVEGWFHALVRRHFRGPLKPPFNEEARAQAGFGPEWYLPLAADD